ncbi:hypothetical protein EV421DRAFT_1743382 [Armillaria borealis]|uniref:F-box domain-containing protein n=1 Tax=Armillaria borealis TaxID=47425 RepID=A0AA39MEC2_9AGAR|nr:hypothetical protein EV421DRAFT_1743382 [Armillaria borealis]
MTTTIHTAPPVSKVPPELLAKIFVSTREGSDYSDCPFRMYDFQEPGYAIAAVCRVWRDVVVRECPSLWACAMVDISQGSTNQAHLLLPVATVLARSRNRPLNIYFQASRNEMDTPDIGMVSEIWTFQMATDLLRLMTSGLAPSTMVDHPYELLTDFKDTHEIVTVENIERILTSISLAKDLKRLEMQYFCIMGDGQDIPNPVVLFRVMELRVGCKIVVDALTMPVLEGLFIEPGFVGWTDFANTDLEPDMLFSLCLALDTILFTFRYWQKFADTAFGGLLRELRWTNDDSTLACAPLLTLVMLHIEYSCIPTVLSFFNEDMVKTMETWVPTNPDGEHTFSLSINVEDSIATLPNCTRTLRDRLSRSGKLGSSCTLEVGLVN